MELWNAYTVGMKKYIKKLKNTEKRFPLPIYLIFIRDFVIDFKAAIQKPFIRFLKILDFDGHKKITKISVNEFLSTFNLLVFEILFKFKIELKLRNRL
jgi:hypothetical protein